MFNIEQVQIVDGQFVRPRMEINYPIIQGLPNPFIQNRLNGIIRRTVSTMIRQQGFGPETMQMLGTYEVTLNQDDLLSLYLENYKYNFRAAHGLTIRKSLTMDTGTGRVYRLADLFLPGVNYVGRLSEIVQEQILERDIPLIVEFTGISPNQAYYLTPTELVLYFQLYEIAPYSAGIVEFPIPYTQIGDILLPTGPISRL